MEITLTEFEEALDKRFVNVATKDDLKGFATKEDLGKFATKEDLKQFATKEYLDGKLSNFATKTDLENVVKEMKTFTEDQIEKLALNIQQTIALPLEELKKQQKIIA